MENTRRKSRKNWKQKSGILNYNNRRCPKPHRLVVTDRKSNIQFLVAPDAQVSLFPKFLASEKPEEIEDSQVLVNNSGSIIHTFGQITREIDLGLGKLFFWKFALVNYERPVIGNDFLSHFRLKLNFEKMCLENPETGLQTANILTVACECHRNENSNDGWPIVTAVSKRNVKHRHHVTDKISKLPFLVGFASQISIFPKSKLKGEVLEPFDGSFRIDGLKENVLGWTTRKLDFGTGREFTWKFIVVKSGLPIIGLDFLSMFGLNQQLKMGYYSLFDSQTKLKTPAPTGPCDCGNRTTGWPTSSLLTVIPTSKSENQREGNSDAKGNSGPVQIKPETFNENPELSEQRPELSRKSPKAFYQNPNYRKFRPFRRYNSRNPTKFTDRGIKFEKPKEKSDKKSPETNRESVKKINSSIKKKPGVKHRLHVDDKNSKQPFLIDTAAAISVFPKSAVKEEDMEPFDGSFELNCGNGEAVKILGWTTRTLDIGLPRNFTWNFAVTDIGKPIIGQDFINYYRFTVCSEGLIDSETNLTTPPPSGPCDCGKNPDGWPTFSLLRKKLVSGSSNPETQKEETEISGKDSEILQENEESRETTNSLKNTIFDVDRLHVNDKSSNMALLTDNATEVSVFPKSEEKEKVLELFNQSLGIPRPAEVSDIPKSEEKEDVLEPYDESFEVPCPAESKTSSDNATEVSDFPKAEEKEDVLELSNESFEIPLPVESKTSIDSTAEVSNFSKSEEKEELSEPFGESFEVPCQAESETSTDSTAEVSNFSKLQETEEVLEPLDESFEVSGSAESETSTYSTAEISDFAKSEEKEDVLEPSDESFEIPLPAESKTSTNQTGSSNVDGKFHRCHINEKKSNLPFLIGKATLVSVFPKSEMKKEDLEPSDGSFQLEGGLGEVIPVLGWTTRTLDIGLDRTFTWRFAVINIGKPILGLDFIRYYGFTIGKMGLIDPETKEETPAPCGPCDCERFPDGWPILSYLALNRTPGASEAGTQKETKSIPRFCIDEKNSDLLFLIDTETAISLFPKSQVEEDDMECYHQSFELYHDYYGTIMSIIGWTIRTLDIGLRRNFVWQFAVVDIDNPILGRDFIKYYASAIDEEKLIDREINQPMPPSSGTCDFGNLYDGSPISTILKAKEIPVKLEEINSTKLTNCGEPELPKRTSHEVKHHFHLMDKNSKMQFFVSEMAQVSIFPRSQIQGRSMEASKSSEMIDCDRVDHAVYGHLTLDIDFGLGREFKWKFAVTDTLRPIIGLDFLKHFDLMSDYQKEYPRLLDPETGRETPEYRGSCDCGGCYKFPHLMDLKESVPVSEEFLIQEKIYLNNTRCNDSCPQEERIILVNKETGMPYLISGAAVSVYPKSEAKEEEIEPFDYSFDLINAFGSVIPIYGWITRKLDFGLGRYFEWKFAVISINKPMISNDFLSHYDLTIAYDNRSVFDNVTSKTVVGSSEFCKCQAKNYWPDISTMEKKLK